jgi:GNAT superfamily N-acetyltransferase
MAVAAFTVRLLGPGDADLLADPADDVFDDAVVPALAAEFLADPRHHLAAAVADGRIIGFASGVHYVHPDKPAQMFINEVGVAGPWQRRGVGRAVMAALLTQARALGCREAWVLTDDDNVAARGLYAAAGGSDAPAGRIFVIDVGA